MKHKKITITLLFSSILFLSGCSSTLSDFHQKNIDTMAKLKSQSKSEQQRNTDSSSNLTFTLDLLQNNDKFIQPELLRVAIELIDDLDSYYKQQKAYTSSEFKKTEDKLAIFKERLTGDSQFNEDVLNIYEYELYKSIDQCYIDLIIEDIPQFLSDLASAKQNAGIKMTYEHDMNYIQKGVFDEIGTWRWGSIEDMNYYADLFRSDREAADDYINNSIKFNISNVQASNNDPTLIKVSYSFTEYDIESGQSNLSTRTETFRMVQNNEDMWKPKYIYEEN